MKPRKPSIDVIGLARCTGCFGCQSACAKEAVELVLDADGFYKPIIDRKKCNECGVCQQSCPVLADQGGKLSEGKWAEPKAFAAWTKDEQLRPASSSGGMFSELARTAIDAGGAVAGCVWGKNWTPKHVVARTWTEVAPMRGSKYVPSYLGKMFRKVDDVLRDGEKPVLFSGSPCQVAAMEAALNPEQRKRVLLVEFTCHGVPSLRVFHRYLEELFGGEAVASYTFRDKLFGWLSVRAVSISGKRHHLPASGDAFFQGFALHHLYVMESCPQCPFARLPRVGDITLGDFWGCPEQWDDRRGVSVVLANTPAGMFALERLAASGRIDLKPTDMTTAIARNPRAVPAGHYSQPSDRRAFLDGLARGKGFGELKTRYFPTRWQTRWMSFCMSRSKWRFLAFHVYHCLRRPLRPRFQTRNDLGRKS